MFDTHMHTEYSSDSKMKINKVIDKSIKYNMGVIITEHMDLNYRDKSKFRFDINDYFDSYNKYRNNKLLLGIEIGMCNKYLEENKSICIENPFDYVLGSLHEMYDIDLYEAEELYKNKNQTDFYQEYFQQMVSCVDTHDFINSLGHIDYIARCAQYEDGEIYYEEYGEYIDEVLKKIIDKGITIELNTRRLSDKKAVENLIKIYKRFYDLGGRYVTIGSDAHKDEDIGKNFNIAENIINDCNLKAVYFKNKKMEFI
ncbi:histidinol phosphate phosphatase [Clostridium sp. JNZ J1-5]